MPEAASPSPTAPTSTAPSAAATRRLLSACFFVSGAAGLVYEVLWSRHLHLLFGSTTESVAAVLATFMAGLGLGGHLLGRAADRSRSPMRLYALCEIGVGLYALLTPPLLSVARLAWSSLGPHLGTGAAAIFVKLLLSAIVLLPPATLMGGTLPALLRATSETDDKARAQVGLLYALNTLGAVAGTLLCGFVLIEVLGLTASMRLTAVTNIGIGALIWARARRHAATDPIANSPSLDEPRAGPWAILRALLATGGGRYAAIGLFASGATVMLAEVVFTRVLGLVFGVSSYAFTIVLAVFLAGLGIGALLSHRWTRDRPPRLADFAVAQAIFGALSALTMALVPSVPRLVLYARQVPDLGFWDVLVVKAAIAVLILLPLSIAAGLGVPLLLAALASDLKKAGRLVGDAYMINTVGTLVGSLVAGFILVEHLGTQGSLRVAAVASLMVAIGGLFRSLGASRGSRFLVALSSVVALVVLLGAPRWPPITFLLSDTRAHHVVASSRMAMETHLRVAPSRLLYFAEGREATVAVTAWGDRTLYVNGHPDASDSLDMATQLGLGVIPVIAHPHPEDVLVIGFGSGVTASAPLRVSDVKRVDVAELERAVLSASPWFHHINGAVENDPRVRLIYDDARSFLVAPPHPYDVIMSEPSNPWRAGVASLFTVEFYREAKAALKPGGVFAQWVQLYSIGDDTLRLILRTLATEFPELQIWWLDPGNIVVLGSSQPLLIDGARVSRIAGGTFAAELRRHAWLGDPDELFGRFLLGTRGVREFAGLDGPNGGELPVNSDELPLLEYEAPRGLFEGDGQNVLRLLEAKMRRGELLPPIAGPPPPESATWTSLATLLWTSRRIPEARRAADRAISASPTARALAFAATLAVEANDVRAAESLLDAARAAHPEGDTARLVGETTAQLRVKQHRLDEAVAALDAAGDLDGLLGLQRLRALIPLGRDGDALAQAERILSHTRLGGAVGPIELEQVYLALIDLAARGGDPLAIASLVEKYPIEGFNPFPREKALAQLFERGRQPAIALSHAEAALAGDALDVKLFEVKARALSALGRTDEAAATLARLAWLQPGAKEDIVLPSSAIANPITTPIATPPATSPETSPATSIDQRAP